MEPLQGIEPEILSLKSDWPCLRYFTIEKFLDLILTHTLFFSRADTLDEDPIIGDSGKAASQELPKVHGGALH